MIGEWNYDGCHAWHACMHLLLLPSSLDDLAKSRKDERDIDCVPKCTWFGDENMNEIKRNCLVNCMRFARGERRGAAPSMQARTLSRCLLACAHTTKLLSGAALRFLQLRAEFERPSSRTGGNVRIERNSAATLCTYLPGQFDFRCILSIALNCCWRCSPSGRALWCPYPAGTAPGGPRATSSPASPSPLRASCRTSTFPGGESTSCCRA